ASDRTLFFDFLPLNALVIKGFVTKFQLYTVPGQVIYNATRQLVLRSVDGIVFVADSQWEKMEENVESFKNLEDNMAKQNMSLDDIPYVLQYNKRDLPNIAPVNYLEYVLNNRKKRVQSFEVVSSTGQNVFATLNAVSQTLLHKFSKQSDSSRGAAPMAGAHELARRIGEIEFNALYHQGNGSHIFMNSVDEETIMITVFGPRTTVGLVRFYSTGTAQQVALLLKALQKANHGFTFEASDI